MTPHGSSTTPHLGWRPTPPALWRLALLWGLVVMASFVAIAIYARTPGRQVPPKATADATFRSHHPKAWRIAIAIHPQCPCSRASIANLQQLLRRHEATFAVDLFVYRPSDASPEWSDTALVRQAQQLPAVTLHDDPNGASARALGIETSGALVLYSPEGAAVFYGGITSSRGHEGANEGLKAIEDTIAGKPVAMTTHPAYGCPLFGSGGAS